jgi:pyridoxal phosphate enzyme (YggS family)
MDRSVLADTEGLTRGELAERIGALREQIATAARRAGRDAADITLLGVTKEHPAELVMAAYEAGLRAFGENRVEEALPKTIAVESWLRAGLGNPAAMPEWHMIGHLQSRKAAQVLPWAALLHSVDSEKLARRLSTLCAGTGRALPILLEVNVAAEESKFGFAPADVPAAVESILALPALKLQGLMAVAPVAEDPDEVRPVFAALRALLFDLAGRFPEADWRHLSMGMSDDFAVAIEEGATIVRIGRALFGERASCRTK